MVEKMNLFKTFFRFYCYECGAEFISKSFNKMLKCPFCELNFNLKKEFLGFCYNCGDFFKINENENSCPFCNSLKTELKCENCKLYFFGERNSFCPVCKGEIIPKKLDEEAIKSQQVEEKIEIEEVSTKKDEYPNIASQYQEVPIKKIEEKEVERGIFETKKSKKGIFFKISLVILCAAVLFAFLSVYSNYKAKKEEQKVYQEATFYIKNGGFGNVERLFLKLNEEHKKEIFAQTWEYINEKIDQYYNFGRKEKPNWDILEEAANFLDKCKNYGNVQDNKIMAKKYFIMGRKAIENEDWYRAKDYLKKAKDYDPNWAFIYHSLGILYANEKSPFKDFFNAEKYYKTALDFDPNSKYTHQNLGSLYYNNLKDKERALKHFEKYLKLIKPGKDEVIEKMVKNLKKIYSKSQNNLEEIHKPANVIIISNDMQNYEN
jgi:tetratricopeptide (TPR) repeat protein